MRGDDPARACHAHALPIPCGGVHSRHGFAYTFTHVLAGAFQQSGRGSDLHREADRIFQATAAADGDRTFEGLERDLLETAALENAPKPLGVSQEDAISFSKPSMPASNPSKSVAVDSSRKRKTR